MTDGLGVLDRRLASLRQARPDLSAAVDLHGALVRECMVESRRPLVEPFVLPRERVAGLVREGTPLLHGAPASVDVHYAADLFGRLVNVVAGRQDAETDVRLGPLVEAATGGALDPHQLFAEAFVQHADHLSDVANQVSVDADTLISLAGLSVAPLLRAYAAHLLPLVEQVDDGTPDGAIWQRGYCPVCGAWPLLGELRGVAFAEYLRCSACGAGWRWRRLACPYCETDDFR